MMSSWDRDRSGIRVAPSGPRRRAVGFNIPGGRKRPYKTSGGLRAVLLANWPAHQIRSWPLATVSPGVDVDDFTVTSSWADVVLHLHGLEDQEVLARTDQVPGWAMGLEDEAGDDGREAAGGLGLVGASGGRISW